MLQGLIPPDLVVPILEGVLATGLTMLGAIAGVIWKRITKNSEEIARLRERTLPRSDFQTMRNEILGAIHSVERNMELNVLDRVRQLEHKHEALDNSHSDLRVQVAELQRCQKG